MRSGWTLYGLPMDAREQAGNYQVVLRACFLLGGASELSIGDSIISIGLWEEYSYTLLQAR